MNSTTLPESAKSAQNTKRLLNKAVHNSSIFSRKGIQDRLFTAWFDRLVYPQIWEDPEVDIQALQLNQDSRIFTISSGGCNVLNYLTEQPQSVTVVDLNEAHIALLNLKLAALHHLPDAQSFYQFFGQADQKQNLQLYKTYLEPHLDATTRAYWNKRQGWLRRSRISLFTRNFYRFGLLGQFIGLIHWVSKRLGYDISQVMQAQTLEEQQKLFDRHVAPVFDTRLLKWLCNRPVVLYSLGIPPSQFNEMAEDSKELQQGMHQLLKERARRLACDYPLDENYFAWQAFARKYDHQGRKAVPRYLQEKHFNNLQHSWQKVDVHHQSMTARLAQMPNQSLTSYLFLDAQDWMDEKQLNELWEEVDRTAQEGARVVFRTAGRISPLEGKLNEDLLANWRTDSVANAEWTRQDRSAIYGAVFVYQKNIGSPA
ncbi:DUF3419 family protein [Thiomicrorhabdus sp. 6S2-11]|uniref:DUF3419 family protein n=1 Tax=Thiomicrorhabdus marina TaxID=2818442 RepID=A0ABS3Q3B9_9GAMM|nr:DUF3419 family protein [Thiomicrorhabdus marina]MBO1926439.1 DUF3419 family protein [Thiomicrorhabdus marina]